MPGMYFLPSSSSFSLHVQGGQSHFLISNPKHCQSQNHNEQILQRNPESEFQTHHDQAAAWSGKADVDLERMQWKRGGFNLWVDPVVQVKGEKLGAPILPAGQANIGFGQTILFWLTKKVLCAFKQAYGLFFRPPYQAKLETISKKVFPRHRWKWGG